VSSSGARSCHMTFSGGFCEVGVKKDATAVSIKRSVSRRSLFEDVRTCCGRLHLAPDGRRRDGRVEIKLALRWF
jgi:hypothetical protein